MSYLNSRKVLGIACLSLPMIAHAASWTTDLKYQALALKFNTTEAPKTMWQEVPRSKSSGGNQYDNYIASLSSNRIAIGETTHVEYDSDHSILWYYSTASWEILELLRSGVKKTGMSKAKVRETFKSPMVNPLIASYCGMSGSLYEFRRDGVNIGYKYDLAEFGKVQILVGESSCD